MSERNDKKELNLYDYHKHNLIYISDYIKFADAKAGVALGANLLLLGFFGKYLKKSIFLDTVQNKELLLVLILCLPIIYISLNFNTDLFFIYSGLKQVQIDTLSISLENIESILIIIYALGLIPLIFSAYFFVWKVLWPRYSIKGSYMSWGGISSFEKSEDYAKKLVDINEKTFLDDMAKQNHELAQICAKKYSSLKYGFAYLTLGAVIESLLWFFIK